MSGPVPMLLGPFAFEATGFGFDGLSRRVQTPWADVAVAQTLNQQQWTGPTSEEVTIKGVLFTVEMGGQESLEGIIAAAKAGIPLMLVSGDLFEGTIHGTYTVQGVDEDRGVFTGYGVARRNAYSINLKRFQQSASGIGSVFDAVVDFFL